MGYLALFLWLAGMVISWQLVAMIGQVRIAKLGRGEKFIACALWPILALVILIG